MPSGRFGFHEPVRSSPVGLAVEAGREGAAAQRLESQEQRLQSQESRAGEQHELSQVKGRFDLERSQEKAQQEDEVFQFNKRKAQYIFDMAQREDSAKLWNLGMDALETGPGGKVAADYLTAAYIKSGKSFDEGVAPVDYVAGTNEKGEPVYYGVDLEGNRVKINGEEVYVRPGIRKETTVVKNKEGEWIKKDGRWLLSKPSEEAKKPADVGTIPSGQRLVTTPGGGYKLENIPGGPASAKAGKAAEAEKMMRQQTTTKATIVVREVDKAIDAIVNSIIPAAGPLAYATKFLPFTSAWQLPYNLDSLKANIGFAELQRMRQASPTGGALGQVSDRENALLQAIQGSLAQEQDPNVLLENLRQLRDLYLDAWFGSEAERQQAVAEGRMSPQQAADTARQRESVKFDSFGRMVNPPWEIHGTDEDRSAYVEVRELPDGRKIGKRADGTKEFVKGFGR